MKQTIVMIHGMWGTAHVWDRFKQYFAAAGYQCITPVLRYHDVPPESPPNPSLGRTSLLDYVKDLEAELSKLTSKPIIMGHSMGGLLAQMLGERGLAESLVLLSPAPPAGLEIFNMSSARTFLSEMLTPGFWNKAVRLTRREAEYGLFNLCPREIQDQLYAACVHESGRATFETAFWFFDRMKTSVVDAEEVRCRQLIIAGTEDHIIPIYVARRIANKYQATAVYKELSGHAHWLIEEPGWEEIAATIEGWVESAGTAQPVA